MIESLNSNFKALGGKGMGKANAGVHIINYNSNNSLLNDNSKIVYFLGLIKNE